MIVEAYSILKVFFFFFFTSKYIVLSLYWYICTAYVQMLGLLREFIIIIIVEEVCFLHQEISPESTSVSLNKFNGSNWKVGDIPSAGLTKELECLVSPWDPLKA